MDTLTIDELNTMLANIRSVEHLLERILEEKISEKQILDNADKEVEERVYRRAAERSEILSILDGTTKSNLKTTSQIKTESDIVSIRTVFACLEELYADGKVEKHIECSSGYEHNWCII